MNIVRRVVIVLLGCLLTASPGVAAATVFTPVATLADVSGAGAVVTAAAGGRTLVLTGSDAPPDASVPGLRGRLELLGSGLTPVVLDRGYVEASGISPDGAYVAWGERSCRDGEAVRAAVMVRRTVAGARPRAIALPAGYRAVDIQAIVLTAAGRVTVLALGEEDCDGDLGVHDAILTAAPGSHRFQLVASTPAGEGHDGEYGVSPNGRTFALCTTPPSPTQVTGQVVAVTAGPRYRVARSSLSVGFEDTLSCAASNAGTATLFDASSNGRVRLLSVGLGAARAVPALLRANQYPVGFALSPSGRQAVLDEPRAVLIYSLVSRRHRTLALPAADHPLLDGGLSNGVDPPLSWVNAHTIVSVFEGPRFNASYEVVLNPVSGHFSRLLSAPLMNVGVCDGSVGPVLSAVDPTFGARTYSRFYLTDPGSTSFSPIQSTVSPVLAVSCPPGSGSIYLTVSTADVSHHAPATILSSSLNRLNDSPWSTTAAPARTHRG